MARTSPAAADPPVLPHAAPPGSLDAGRHVLVAETVAKEERADHAGARWRLPPEGHLRMVAGRPELGNGRSRRRFEE
jgi:hypothetical protein